MNVPEWIQWMGAHFSPEAYLFWTRWQCLAWTLADLVIVAGLLAMANLARRLMGERRHLFSWIILSITALFTPFVVLAPSGRFLFLLELLITAPHFLIILYVLLSDADLFARSLHRLIGRDQMF